MTNIYRPRRRGGSAFWRVASVSLLAVLGVVIVLWAIDLFRDRADARQGATNVAETSDAQGESDQSIDSVAALADASGTAVGVVTRSGTALAPSYVLVAQLPPIDSAANAYTVWLIAEGLADVLPVGDLTPRADGSWALTFTTSDPLAYPNVVVTLEPNDGDARPSGARAAEGNFK